MPGPNVVIVIMDDLAYGDLACHGNPHTRTPHLDRLHGESTRLTRQDWRLYGVEEGWNSDNPGYWLVEIAAKGAYSLRIETDILEGMENAALHFKCGGLHIERRISSWDRTEFAFERVVLEDGAHTLEAYVEHDGKKRGVRRVIVGKLAKGSLEGETA